MHGGNGLLYPAGIDIQSVPIFLTAFLICAHMLICSFAYLYVP